MRKCLLNYRVQNIFFSSSIIQHTNKGVTVTTEQFDLLTALLIHMKLWKVEKEMI